MLLFKDPLPEDIMEFIMIRMRELSPNIRSYLEWLHASEWNQGSVYKLAPWNSETGVDYFLMTCLTWISPHANIESTDQFTEATTAARADNRFLCERSLMQTAEYPVFLESFVDSIKLPVNVPESLFKMKEVLHVL